jgi:polar amino acid transport system substrate-binding protein
MAMALRWLLALVAWAGAPAADGLEAVRARGSLVWGGDQEGGGPYVYPDPEDPARLTGFEVALGDLLARELGVKARFSQGPWDGLPALLQRGDIDMVLNGYELTAARAASMAHTRPYYVYELVLLARRGDLSLRGWADLSRPREGRLPRVGALVGSAAHGYLDQHWRDRVEVVTYDGNTDAMREVETGKLEATLQDRPIATFYRDRFPGLEPVGEPVARGHYVIYLRRGEARLKEALDGALARLMETGELRALYRRYGIWNQAQEELPSLGGKSEEELGIRATELRGWKAVASRAGLLLRAATMTVGLACGSMPLAIGLGLLVALGRLYGPRPLPWLLTGYVEVLRGTPLMLQLYVIFFLLPEIGLAVPPVEAAILGLAINYSAYESEIYRAGLLAIPRGQMEAALALGMSRPLALRRIILPQATRLVIPPVTNDFIALFKDTSVCSVITVMELTKQYNVQRNDTGATIELAALTGLLYLAMSLPLSRLANVLERRLAGGAPAA